MGLLSWWFGKNRASDERDSPQVKEIVERIVRLGPQLRLARDCEARMAPAVRRSLDFLRELVADLPASREASAAAWATDPYLHAFFATPDDVGPVFSHSEALRAYFDAHPDAHEAVAVLGMNIDERRILGVAQSGATTRTDVAQTTVSFSDHQVRLCAESEAALRQQIMLRVIDQLALEALGKIADDSKRRDSLEHERALLKTRLTMLERQGTGARSLLGSDASCSFAEVAKLQTQLDENDQALANLGLKTEALERHLEMVCGVLSSPDSHFHVAKKRFLLDRMNVVVDDGDTRPAHELEIHTARVPASSSAMRAFSMVRFKRADLLPARDMMAEARRLLV